MDVSILTFSGLRPWHDCRWWHSVSHYLLEWKTMRPVSVNIHSSSCTATIILVQIH